MPTDIEFQELISTIVKDITVENFKEFNNLFARNELSEQRQQYILGLDINSTGDIEKSNIIFLCGLIFSFKNQFDNAIESYKRSIQLNPSHFFAMNSLGCIYSSDIYGHLNYSAAVEWFEKAIKLDYSTAMNNRAQMHIQGLGGLVDNMAAIGLYKKAINLDDPRAMYEYAQMHEDGLGIPVDYSAAIKLYEQAADLKYIEAMIRCGLIYEEGRELAVPINFAAAIKWYDAAIDLYNAIAMYYRACMYALGKGSNIDKSKASILYFEAFRRLNEDDEIKQYSLEWLQDLGKEGEENANYYLGKIYFFGSESIIKADFEKSLGYFRKCNFNQSVWDSSGIGFIILLKNNEQPISLLSRKEISLLLERIKNCSGENLTIILDEIENTWDKNMFSIRSIVSLLQECYPDFPNVKAIVETVNARFKNFIQEIIHDPNAKKVPFLIASLYRKEVSGEQQKYILDLSFEDMDDIQKSNLWCLQGIIFREKGEYVKAIEAFDMSICLNPENSHTISCRAFMHMKAQGGPKDHHTASKMYDQAIKLGSITAIVVRAYKYVHGPKKNYLAAIHLYDQAISACSPAAMIDRAYMHAHGLGGNPNQDEAIKLLKQAVAFGYVIAIFDLADIYRSRKDNKASKSYAACLYFEVLRRSHTDDETRKSSIFRLQELIFDSTLDSNFKIDLYEFLNNIQKELEYKKNSIYRFLFYLEFILTLKYLKYSDKKYCHILLNNLYLSERKTHLAEWHFQQLQQLDEKNERQDPQCLLNANDNLKSLLDLNNMLDTLIGKFQEFKPSDDSIRIVTNIFIFKFETYKTIIHENEFLSEMAVLCLGDDEELLSEFIKDLIIEEKLQELLKDLSNTVTQLMSNLKKYKMEIKKEPNTEFKIFSNMK